MAKLVLAGGTDVAELALFDVDALVDDRPPNPALLNEAESRQAAVRFQTGADGAYLLHAYLDEEIPAAVLKYCSADDKKSAVLSVVSGKLSFGGVESMYSKFKPNPSIRTDALVKPGIYDVTAYRTEYPDGLIEGAVKARIGTDGYRFLNAPGYIIPIALLLVVIGRFLGGWIAAASIAGISVVALSVFFRSGAFKRLTAEKRAVELEYPSIVVGMRLLDE